MKKIRKIEHMKWLGMFLFLTMIVFFFSGPAWATVGDDLVGTWTGLGVWMRHSGLREYFQLHGKDATLLAKGDFNCDGIEDLVGYWPHLGVEGLWVRYGGNNPPIRWENIEIPPPLAIGDLVSLTAGDMNDDGKDDIVGGGVESVLYRSGPGTWVPLLNEPAKQMATGDFDNDGRDDLVAWVNDDFWIWDGQTGGVKTIIRYPEDTPPGVESIISIGTGDMNCDGSSDIIFSWEFEDGSVYYLDGTTIEGQNFRYVRLYTGLETAIQVTSGDIDGDGCDDLLGVWENYGVWVRYSRTENWEELHKDPALYITAVCVDENMPPE